MLIRNITRSTELARSASEAKSFIDRLKGLIGKKHFKKGEALIFRNCPSVHTFGMRFPIDLLFADKHLKILMSIHDLRPYAFSPLVVRASFTIELPAGTLIESRTQVGDDLALIR